MGELSRVNSDQMLLNMWLHGRPATTTQSYRRCANYLFSCTGKHLDKIVLEDLQNHSDHLYSLGLKESSVRTKLNAIKSLFTFATKLNYIRFNVAAALRIPKNTRSLKGRILKQADVLKLINGAKPGRDRSLLKLMYATGMRVSEACNLRWNDFDERETGEIQVTVLGKGSKLRTVLVPVGVWIEMEALKGEDDGDTPVFKNTKGGFLDRTVAHRMVKQAAAASGIDPKVSSHFLRHAHCQHALARGAPIHLVRSSVGHSNISVTDVYLTANPEDSSSNYLGL